MLVWLADPLFQAFSPISTTGREKGRKLAKGEKKRKAKEINGYSPIAPFRCPFLGHFLKDVGATFWVISVTDRSVAMVTGIGLFPNYVL